MKNNSFPHFISMLKCIGVYKHCRQIYLSGFEYIWLQILVSHHSYKQKSCWWTNTSELLQVREIYIFLKKLENLTLVHFKVMEFRMLKTEDPKEKSRDSFPLLKARVKVRCHPFSFILSPTCQSRCWNGDTGCWLSSGALLGLVQWFSNSASPLFLRGKGLTPMNGHCRDMFVESYNLKPLPRKGQ